MQDIRIRLMAATVLSFTAFISPQGAFGALIWLLVFSRTSLVIKNLRLIISFILLIGFFSVIIELTGGGGISYFIRMFVIVLIGSWVYSEYHEGEFLKICTWGLGNRIGFDLGMVAEMGMQSMDTLTEDFKRIRMAERLKGIHPGIRAIVPSGIILVKGSIIRAQDSAELMAMRGYTSGGSFCPEFRTPSLDIIGGFAAICVGIFSIVPISEFFILYR